MKKVGSITMMLKLSGFALRGQQEDTHTARPVDGARCSVWGSSKSIMWICAPMPTLTFERFGFIASEFKRWIWVMRSLMDAFCSICRCGLQSDPTPSLARPLCRRKL